MSETNFTPGPWAVSGTRDPSRGQRVAGTVAGETFTICYAETPQQGGSPRHDMREGNAHLIAAAPDLYEAGGSAVSILESYIEFLHRIPADELEQHPYIPAVEEAFDLLSAALAKARGQS
jgi:hypothetical protein